MQVKVGNILSALTPITRGAVQGSILGVMDHNAVLESIEEHCAFNLTAEKYVDDLTVVEEIPKETPCMTESDGEIVMTRAKKTERAVEIIKEKIVP